MSESGRRFCENCGTEIRQTTNFCPNCGAAQRPDPEVPTGPPPPIPEPGRISTPRASDVPSSPPPQQPQGSLLRTIGGVVVIIVLLIILAGLCGGGRESSKGGSTTNSDSDAKEEAKKGKNKQSAAPAEEPAPINLSGVGQQATGPFDLESGLAIFWMTHQGDGHFSSTLLDSNGNRTAGMDSLLANLVGPFDGSRVIQAESGKHVIDVSASGPWTIMIEQPRPSSAPETTRFDGNSQAATDFFELSQGLKTFYMTHQGSGHFGVHLLNKDGSRLGMDSLLANDVGAFDGSKAVRIPKEDIYLLQVDADGPWTIQVE